MAPIIRRPFYALLLGVCAAVQSACSAIPGWQDPSSTQLRQEVAALRQEVSAIRPAVERMTQLEGTIRAALVDLPHLKQSLGSQPSTAVSRPAPLVQSPDRMTATPAATPAVPTPPAPQPVSLTSTAGEIGGEFGVHLASYKNESQILPGWAVLQQRHPVLQGLKPIVTEVDFQDGRGTFYRLKAGPLQAAAAAQSICAAIRSRSGFCQLDEYAGHPARQTAER
jgi:hypothetical protein